MTLDHALALFSAAIPSLTLLVGAGGLLTVILQLRNAARQRETDARQRETDAKQREAAAIVKIYDVNRELVSLGFAYPELFAILQGDESIDPVWQQRYLQLWLNHLSSLHLYLTHSIYATELKDSESRALAQFMTLRNMRRHWQENAEFYPASFQQRVNAIIEKGEPHKAAHRDSGTEHLPGDLLEGRTWHPHEAFALRGGQHGVGVRAGNEALDEQVPIVGDDCGGTRAAVAQFLKLPIFPNYSLDVHNVVNKAFRLLKRNYTFCCAEPGGAFV